MVIRAGGEAGHGGNIVRGQRMAMGQTYGLVEHSVDAGGGDQVADLRQHLFVGGGVKDAQKK